MTLLSRISFYLQLECNYFAVPPDIQVTSLHAISFTRPSFMIMYDLLSENPALSCIYENHDKKWNRYIDVQLCGSKRIEVIGCLVLELQRKLHQRC